MPGPMEGVKIVELAVWVAGPASSGILADWGADVIKIEAPPAGDPYRAFYSAAVGIPLPINPMFELDNRGKRSLVVDLAPTPVAPSCGARSPAPTSSSPTSAPARSSVPASTRRRARGASAPGLRARHRLRHARRGARPCRVRRRRVLGPRRNRAHARAAGRRAALSPHRLRRSRDRARARRWGRGRALRARAHRSRPPRRRRRSCAPALHRRRRHHPVLRLGIPPIPLRVPRCRIRSARSIARQTHAGSSCLGCRPTATGPTCYARSTARRGSAIRASSTSARGRTTYRAHRRARRDLRERAVRRLGRASRCRRHVVGAGADDRDAVRDPQVAASGAFIDVPAATARRACSRRRSISATTSPRPTRRAGAGPAHRRGPARAWLRLGRHRGAEGGRRDPLTERLDAGTPAPLAAGAWGRFSRRSRSHPAPTRATKRPATPPRNRRRELATLRADVRDRRRRLQRPERDLHAERRSAALSQAARFNSPVANPRAAERAPVGSRDMAADRRAVRPAPPKFRRAEPDRHECAARQLAPRGPRRHDRHAETPLGESFSASS